MRKLGKIGTLFFALALGVTTLGGASWGVFHEANAVDSNTYEEVVSLTFPDDNKDNNKTQDYTSTKTYKKDTFDFKVSNFNNNNWKDWTFIKCGRKSIASIGTITSQVFTESITRVTINIYAITAAKINSITLFYGDSESSATNVLGTFDKGSTGEKELIFEPKMNKCFKLSVDCASCDNSNGPFALNSITFYKSNSPTPTGDGVTSVSLTPTQLSLTVDGDSSSIVPTVTGNGTYDNKVRFSASPSGSVQFSNSAAGTYTDTLSNITSGSTVYVKVPSGVTATSATITATSQEDIAQPKTANATVTISKGKPVIADGSYVIYHTKNDKTYYLKKNAEDKKAPSPVENEEDATVFTFTRQANGTYTIMDGDSYLYMHKDDNNCIAVGNTVFYWNIDNGTKPNATGEYDFYATIGNTTRYLCLYSTQDFRAYNSSTHSNRTENTSIKAVTPTFKVTYDANGGTGDVPTDDTKYNKGDNPVVLGPGNLAKEFHTFSCWKDSNGTSYDEGDTIENIQGVVTLYAQWDCTYEYKGAGTKLDPFNVADGRYKAIYDSNDGEYFVKGIVSKISGNSYDIVDEPGDTTSFKLYGLKYNNVNVTTGYEVGDPILCMGKIINYNGNTPETNPSTLIVEPTSIDADNVSMVTNSYGDIDDLLEEMNYSMSGPADRPVDPDLNGISFSVEDEDILLIDGDEFLVGETAGSTNVTITSTYDSTLTKTITFVATSPDAPVLDRVNVEVAEGKNPVTPQYDGQQFNSSNLIFTAVYIQDEEESSVPINASDISWNNPLVYDETLEVNHPTGEYTDPNDQGNTVDVVVTQITILPDVIESLEISGDFTKKLYDTHENWDFSGLTVTAIYSSGDSEIITDAEFAADKTTAEVGVGENKSVGVTASLGTVTSAKFTVYGLTIVEYVKPEGFDLVTSQDQIKNGAEIIFVGIKNGQTNAMTDYSTGNNNIRTEEVTIEDNIVTTYSDSVVYRLCAVEGGFAIKSSTGQYIYDASTSDKNYLKADLAMQTDNRSVWTITYDDENQSFETKCITEATTRVYLKYNNSSTNSLFNCYASGQEEFKIYVREGAAFNFINNNTSTNPSVEYTFTQDGDNLKVNLTSTRLRFAVTLSKKDYLYLDEKGYDLSMELTVNEVTKTFTLENGLNMLSDENNVTFTVLMNIPLKQWSTSINANLVATKTIDDKIVDKLVTGSINTSLAKTASDYLNEKADVLTDDQKAALKLIAGN